MGAIMLGYVLILLACGISAIIERRK